MIHVGECVADGRRIKILLHERLKWHLSAAIKGDGERCGRPVSRDSSRQPTEKAIAGEVEQGRAQYVPFIQAFQGER